eukprot:TRINITY_DN28214_c0_g1_i1.p1 TRINITY_DN28214_c0_g1~~TRINITY_DN28214_c0_g1_i1.p1  ORF type:complete len:660 (-),score=105.88 TRINITY_DN28214_c0_g1_i1:58-2037(-)
MLWFGQLTQWVRRDATSESTKSAKTNKAEALLPSVIRWNRAHLPVLPARHTALLLGELSLRRSCQAQVRLLLQEPLLLILLTQPGPEDKLSGKDCLTPELGEQLQKAHSAGLTYEGLKSSLLELVPITSRSVGAVRNRFCYHSYEECMDMSPEEAVWSRYEQLKVLGKGHFGEVVLAEEKCSGTKVAVKKFGRVPSQHANTKDDNVECSEGHIQNALGHPNLIRVFEVVEMIDTVYVIMEFAPGATLTKYASNTARGPWLAGAAQQILSATAYCHLCGVLHGDLKPENVLCGGTRPDGCPICLVCDFGHAAICVGSNRQMGGVGDPRYVAPEAAAGEGTTEKSDIFMLGMTFYELLTGGWLPFFNERADDLESAMPFYDATRGWFMLFKGDVQDRMKRGLSFADKKRLHSSKLQHETKEWSAPTEAHNLLLEMLSWQTSARPRAVEALNAPWIMHGSHACKRAREEVAPIEFGLWTPQNSSFAERLARRSSQPLLHRLFLGAIGMCLESDALFSGRLLFRWMDVNGNGFLVEEDFRQAAIRVNLDADAAAEICRAADIYGQGCVDFKNLVSILTDPLSMPDEELVPLMMSLFSRAMGPGKDLTSISLESFFSLFRFPAHRRHTNENLKKACCDWQAQFIGPDEKAVSVDTLLRFVRQAL